MDVFKSMPVPTAPEPEVEQRMYDHSAYVADGHAVVDRRESKDVYASTEIPGSSAIYAREGGTVYLESPRIFGNSPMTDEDRRNELASKYGFCAAVVANCKTSNITLVNPKIVCDPESNANGAYAIFGGAVVLKGGSIYTDNGLGHGVDASYGGFVYCEGTAIHTCGANSGALATDFQGGYITVRDIHATTEKPGSPGIYTAGKSIISAYNSTFISKGCEGVMIAHALGHTYLYDCSVTGTVGLNCHNGGGDDYSYIHMYGGHLTATAGSSLMCDGGNAVMDLDGVALSGNDGNLTNAKSGSRLIANIRRMDVAADAAHGEKSYVEVNLIGSAFKGAANVTAFSVDANSCWEITADSSVVSLNVVPGAVVKAAGPVTVRYGSTADGILPTADNVTFVCDDSLTDDYEPAKMGPPPGMDGPGGPGGPGGPAA